jgi:hypothetical protein
MQTLPITEVDMDRFLTQFTLKNNRMGLLENIPYESGKTSTKEETAQNGYFNSGRNLDWYGEDASNIPLFITVGDGEVFYYSQEISERNGSLYFVPLRQASSLHYNAEQTIEDMMNVVYDTQMIKENSKTSSKRKSAGAIMRELADTNNQEKAVDMTDQNAYSVADNHPSDAQLESMAAAEPKSDEELQAEAEKLTDEGYADRIAPEVEERPLSDLPQPSETDDIQKKIDETQSTGQIDDPFCGVPI